MNRSTRSTDILLGALLLLPTALALAQDGRPPQVYPPGIRGGSEVVPEKGVEIRHYKFQPTGEQLPYSVFVSSKVRKDTPAPLIIALRGFTGTTLTFVRGTAVDLAEQGGYILVGAIGYNNRAGFGVQAPPAPRPAPHLPRAPPVRPHHHRCPVLPPLVGGTAETDPAKVTAYSERDVMNVLDLVRREFNIDERRIYSSATSQGGGGARHLAEKYPTSGLAWRCSPPRCSTCRSPSNPDHEDPAAAGRVKRTRADRRHPRLQRKTGPTRCCARIHREAGAGSRHHHHGRRTGSLRLLRPPRETRFALAEHAGQRRLGCALHPA
jgi:hypothetical protein